MSLEKWKEVFGANFVRYMDEWKEFLRIESVSTDPSYHNECIDCANWLTKHLEALGFETELLETGTKPVVWAQRRGEKTQPTVLYYGHYDVQPPDPLDLWKSKPFEPEIRDGKMFARGSNDNKGQTFYFIKALEALISENKLNNSVTLIIEGEEECGSVGLSKILPDIKDKIAADYLLVCDTLTSSPDIGCITMGLKGIASLEIQLTGPNRDLHSGFHGSLIPNPAEGMSKLLTSLWGEDRNIAVEGYYDEVTGISSEEKKLANETEFNPDEYQAEFGVYPERGDLSYTPQERSGFRPSIDINGMYSGYIGDGSKTIIPSTATAKLSLRLVPNQDPDKAISLVCEHLEKNVPKGLKLEITEKTSHGPALRVDINSEIVEKARQVLTEICPAGVRLSWVGGSVPVLSGVVEVTGAEPLLVGFVLEEDNMHSPNECFGLDQFEKGFLYVASLFDLIQGNE